MAPYTIGETESASLGLMVDVQGRSWPMTRIPPGVVVPPWRIHGHLGLEWPVPEVTFERLWRDASGVRVFPRRLVVQDDLTIARFRKAPAAWPEAIKGGGDLKLFVGPLADLARLLGAGGVALRVRGRLIVSAPRGWYDGDGVEREN